MQVSALVVELAARACSAVCSILHAENGVPRLGDNGHVRQQCSQSPDLQHSPFACSHSASRHSALIQSRMWRPRSSRGSRHRTSQNAISRGLREFRFYSDSENWSQVGRGEGFTRALAAAGQKCEWLRWRGASEQGSGESQWLLRREWLLKQLKAADKPVAIFAANGTLAVEVQELCDDAGIRVPSEVAIVGIDDYLLSVGAANRSVSGVDTNLEEQGYQGAALLDRMMRGAKTPSKPVRIAPAQVITRKSSDILAVSHQGVSRALHFITEHYADSVSVDEVARAAGMSHSQSGCSRTRRTKSSRSQTRAATRTSTPSSSRSARRRRRRPLSSEKPRGADAENISRPISP